MDMAPKVKNEAPVSTKAKALITRKTGLKCVQRHQNNEEPYATYLPTNGGRASPGETSLTTGPSSWSDHEVDHEDQGHTGVHQG